MGIPTVCVHSAHSDLRPVLPDNSEFRAPVRTLLTDEFENTRLVENVVTPLDSDFRKMVQTGFGASFDLAPRAVTVSVWVSVCT